MWAGCVHWFGQICTFKKERPGEIRARVANLPKKLHLSRIPQCARPGTGIALAPVADCRLCAPAHLLPQYCTLLGKTRPRHRPRTGRRLQTADCAPPAHLLPQYCTLLGKTRPRHRPRTGRRLQTVRPGTSAAPALPVRTACPPHPVLPDHSPRRPTHKPHPQNLTPQNGERRAHQTVDAASTPKGE